MTELPEGGWHGEPAAEPADADDARRLAEEAEAIEESLRGYVDQRLESVWHAVGERPPQSRWSRLARWRVDLYFVVTTALLLLIWLRQPPPPPTAPAAGSATAGATAGRPEASAAPPAAGTPAAGTPAAGPGTSLPEGATPDAQWEAFVRANFSAVVDWLRAVAEARGLERAEQVSRLQKGFFADWAGAADVEALVAMDGLKAMRLGLFEYVYGRWFQGREPPPPGVWDKVDRVLTDREYPPDALKLLLDELELADRFPEPKVADEALHVAVVAAWIESHEP